MNPGSTILIFLVSLSSCCLSATQAQDHGDPFSNSDAATATRVEKKPKLVVHTETLDQCIDWMQMNYSMASMKAKISRLREEFKSDVSPERKQQLGKKIEQLQASINAVRKELDSILVTTTIDYVRFQQFKLELEQFEVSHYEQLINQHHAARAEVAELRAENKSLKERIRELEGSRGRERK